MSDNNLYHASFADDAVVGLAKAIKDRQYSSMQEQLHYLQTRIFSAVMEHEVGHTVGLRHNFEGSYDA